MDWEDASLDRNIRLIEKTKIGLIQETDKTSDKQKSTGHLHYSLCSTRSSNT